MDGSATSDLGADYRADEPTVDFPPVRSGNVERATYTDPSGYTEPVAFAAPESDDPGPARATAGGIPAGVGGSVGRGKSAAFGGRAVRREADSFGRGAGDDRTDGHAEGADRGDTAGLGGSAGRGDLGGYAGAAGPGDAAGVGEEADDAFADEMRATPDGGATVAALREQTGNWPRVGVADPAGRGDAGALGDPGSTAAALREPTGSWSQVGGGSAESAPGGGGPALRESTGSWRQVGGGPAESATPDGGESALRESTGSWPRISDYWPDAPHRTGPQADYDPGGTARAGGGVPTYPQEPAPTRLISPPPPPRRPWLRILLSALAALVFLGGSVIALTRLVTRQESADQGAPTVAAQPPGQVGDQGVPSPPVSIEPSPSATASSSPAASATALPFTSGTFELASDVRELNLTVVELGNEPFQVTTPADSGLTPRASIDGDKVKLVAEADDKKGSGRLDVKLNNRVDWALRISGGVRTGTYTLAGADLRRIDLLGGAARIEMALPSQKDTIPIRMSGGVNTWIITTAREVPVRALLRRGGGEVVLNGRRDRGVDRNTTLRARVDDSNAGGLDIDAVAGLGTLTVSPAERDT